MDQIHIGIAKAKVKEDMAKDLEERKKALRKIGDEVRDLGLVAWRTTLKPFVH